MLAKRASTACDRAYNIAASVLWHSNPTEHRTTAEDATVVVALQQHESYVTPLPSGVVGTFSEIPGL